MTGGSTSDAPQQDGAPPWHFREDRSRGGARAAATRAPGIRLAVVRYATAGGLHKDQELVVQRRAAGQLEVGRGGTKPKEVTPTTLFGKGASPSVWPTALLPKFSIQGPPLDPPSMSLP